ncbi:sigma-70 family RNA polymerase sigma factor [Ornithinibacillus sp. BX22]|uniref:Sigma-70 family RNA polymerase sigma factor n=1 Tax=Ornithinibacillus hominis TaxID=2763055 RepID=A0A923L854_9BACI|nr:sigma-70 family RNA polymerase sigma factor [Ornithinibacillus hominis]MBC5638125.1 sigma-70 family RNA polymerase sigma factor [Ornithinibacillus hominis]
MYTIRDVNKAKKGNKKAFAKIIQAEKQRLYRIAFLYVKNENDAVDIVQEATYKALLSIGNMKEINQVAAWLKRITINCAIDFLRRQKKVIPFEDGSVEIVEQRMVHTEEKLDIYDLLDYLNERDKTIIILKYYEDLTSREIAEFLDCPEGTVKSSLHRSLKLLKGKIEEDYMNG